MARHATDTYLPIGPWQDWLRARLREMTREELSLWLGCDTTTISKWINGYYTTRDRQVDVSEIKLDYIDRILTRTSTSIHDLYPELGDVDLESETWCDQCDEMVTSIEGNCPWCESVL